MCCRVPRDGQESPSAKMSPAKQAVALVLGREGANHRLRHLSPAPTAAAASAVTVGLAFSCSCSALCASWLMPFTGDCYCRLTSIVFSSTYCLSDSRGSAQSNGGRAAALHGCILAACVESAAGPCLWLNRLRSTLWHRRDDWSARPFRPPEGALPPSVRPSPPPPASNLRN